MMKKAFKRTLYLGYYFKKMNWRLLKKFLGHASQLTGKSKPQLMLNSIRDVYKYNISILEYFQFGFYSKTESEKKEWVGTGTIYEFQLKANPIKERVILDDKRLFYKNYKEFFVHNIYTLEEIESNKINIEELLENSRKLVLKQVDGKCGTGVKIINAKDYNKNHLLALMRKNNYGMIEDFIIQHTRMNMLSPSAVNTIRIYTNINDAGDYELLGCRIRISVNCPVDNLAAGNLAAPIDERTGIIIGPGVYSDITKLPEEVHPITKVPIVGFQIPFWQEILVMVKKASLKHPENKSIGWDIFVTEEGPGLIEGNHDWCKLVWQLPVNKGLKNLLNV
ncbi:hypothetical protein O4H26_13065 [Aequorivita viscosa]|nr:hypothetical protein [Aequorivita viscosa]